MIPQLINLTRWEWFKLRHRWMPWTILVVILAITQLPLWGTFFDYRSRVAGRIGFDVETSGGQVSRFTTTCEEVRAGRMPALPPGSEGRWESERDIVKGLVERCRVESIAGTREGFDLPNSLIFPLGLISVLGTLLMATLTASTLGTEYSWGTLRTVLARGTGRWKFLSAKLVLIVLLWAGMVAVVEVVTVMGSLLATALAPEPSPEVAAWLDGHSAMWSSTLIVAGRTLVAGLPYFALAAFFTVLTASLAAGMAISLGYYFAEAIAGAMLVTLLKRVDVVSDYLLVRNITAWMLGSKGEGRDSWILGGPFQAGEYPGELHAIVALLVYLVALIGLCFWLVRRRDVPGASGG